MPTPSPSARTFNVFVEGEHYEVVVDPVETGTARKRGPVSAKPPTTRKHGPAEEASKDIRMAAPMPGLLLRYLVQEGATVKPGDPVAVMEAMKMENTLPATAAGTIKTLPLKPGASVRKGDVLVIIAP
jgi:biotin carboxyl carrier protein